MHMTDIARVVINLSGFAGAPGVNVLHFSQGSLSSWNTAAITGVAEDVTGILFACKSFYAPGLEMQVRPEVDIIDVASGEIIDQFVPDDPFGPVFSDATDGAESRATQAIVRLRGDKWVNGRLIQGRMFMGPLAGSILDDDGNIPTNTRDDIQDAFVAITSGLGARLAIYSRPNPTLSKAGDYSDAVAVLVNQKPGVLRSRRD